jgi:excisionase family DNA binding protein
MSEDSKAALGAAMASLMEVPTHIDRLWQKVEDHQNRLLARIDELEAKVEQLQRQLPPMLMRRADAAKHLHVSERTVDRAIAEGTLPTVKVGRTVLCDVTRLRPADMAATTRRVVLGE